MNFVSLENKGKKLFAKFPKTRRFLKKIYQRTMYLISKDDIKSEGNICRISPDNQYEYFYGYYDKSPWDITDKYVLALQVNNARKTPDSVEEATIVVFDTLNNNSIIEIGKTHCWNTQQGCMAQWLGPDFKSRIIYNDFRNGNFCAVIYNFEKKIEEKVLDKPIYDVAKDGTFALTLDFSRLHNLRKGYGYANLKEENKKELCPDSPCVWKIELNTGDIEEILRYTDLKKFETRNEMVKAKHKVNHIMISPNGKRFMVLHRWFKNKEKFTRLLTMNIDGTDIYNLSDNDFVSHCCWKNDHEILSFLRKKEGEHYYLLKDKTQEYRMFWDELNTDGHCTYSHDKKYVITDTYPNRKRKATVYLCEENKNAVKIATVFSPFKYDNDVRCDLHPRWNHKGDKICIDSVHEGKKELYVLDIILKKNFLENVAEKHKITVLMSTYNGEKYIEEQLESLLNQVGVDLNILIRDDGSTDNTIKILEKYQKNNKQIKWYANNHLGASKSFLDLLKNSPETEFYAFCDQDDVWDKDKLLQAISYLTKFPEDTPNLYYCGQRLVDKDLNFISNHYVDNKRSDYTNFLISNVAGCTLVINKSLRDKVNMKTPNFILMHDSWIFKICLALGGNYYVDPKPHLFYRQHGNNAVGLNKGLKSKIRQMRRYINNFKIQKQVQELYYFYGKEMIKSYKEFCLEIMNNNKKSFFKRLNLIKNRQINFNSKGLNFTIKLKVGMKKL